MSDQRQARELLLAWGKCDPSAQTLVNVEHRYRSASTELNQRMTGRHSTYLAFAAATAVFINLLLNRKSDGLTHTLIVFPSVVCFAFSAWIRSQDLTIGLLSAYCRVCESWDSQPLLPAFYSEDQGWWKRAMRHREWMELSFVVIAFILIESPVLLDYGSKPPRPMIPWFCLNQFTFGVCSWMILGIRMQRYRMFDIEIVPIVVMGEHWDQDEVYFGLNEDIKEVPKARSFLFGILLCTVTLGVCLALVQARWPSYLRHTLALVVFGGIFIRFWAVTVECCYLQMVVARGRKLSPLVINWWRKAFSARFWLMIVALVMVYYEGANLARWAKMAYLFPASFPANGSILNPSFLGLFAALMVSGYSVPEFIFTLGRRNVCRRPWIIEAAKFAFSSFAIFKRDNGTKHKPIILK